MDFHLLVASSLVITAILSTRATQRFGLPALVLFVGIGMLAGSSGLGGIVFDDYGLSLDIGLVALAVILFSGGLDTRMRLFKASLVPAISLSTVGGGGHHDGDRRRGVAAYASRPYAELTLGCSTCANRRGCYF